MRRHHHRWPLFLIASPAAVAVWSGWVALGGMCGFGPVNLLPGIGRGFTINTAITLPVGVEAYGAYALGAWLIGGTPERARVFARRSAVGALALGMAGQVIYHLLAAAHAARAPWPVVVVVSCMPVITLGFGAALTHLLSAGSADVQVTPPDEVQATPQVTPESPVQVTPRKPVQVTLWTRPDPVPQVMAQVAVRPPVQATPRAVPRSPARTAFRSPRKPVHRMRRARSATSFPGARSMLPWPRPAPVLAAPQASIRTTPEAAPRSPVLAALPGLIPGPVSSQVPGHPEAVIPVTPKARPRRKTQVTPRRLSDADLKELVRAGFKADPDVTVAGLAKKLKRSRDRIRPLLDQVRQEANVTPMRKRS